MIALHIILQHLNCNMKYDDLGSQQLGHMVFLTTWANESGRRGALDSKNGVMHLCEAVKACTLLSASY